nr:unnamed protein product [Haemonchus contortus]
MLVDEEEFCTDSIDTSYGYAPTTFRRKHLGGESEGEIHLEEKNCALYAEPDCSSFLQTKLNPAPEKSFAVETVIRAGCSADAVLLTEKLKTSPSGLEGLLTKFSEEDGARLATQLEKELTEEWCSTSLFGGLGTDRAGLVVGGSLLQTYDLLCNINLHLLVIQREMLKHENKIRELCRKDELSERSFTDGGNKKQLLRLLHSLETTATSLRDRVASLNRTVMGVPYGSTRSISRTSYFGEYMDAKAEGEWWEVTELTKNGMEIGEQKIV